MSFQTSVPVEPLTSIRLVPKSIRNAAVHNVPGPLRNTVVYNVSGPGPLGNPAIYNVPGPLGNAIVFNVPGPRPLGNTAVFNAPVPVRNTEGNSVLSLLKIELHALCIRVENLVGSKLLKVWLDEILKTFENMSRSLKVSDIESDAVKQKVHDIVRVKDEPLHCSDEDKYSINESIMITNIDDLNSIIDALDKHYDTGNTYIDTAPDDIIDDNTDAVGDNFDTVNGGRTDAVDSSVYSTPVGGTSSDSVVHGNLLKQLKPAQAVVTSTDECFEIRTEVQTSNNRSSINTEIFTSANNRSSINTEVFTSAYESSKFSTKDVADTQRNSNTDTKIFLASFNSKFKTDVFRAADQDPNVNKEVVAGEPSCLDAVARKPCKPKSTRVNDQNTRNSENTCRVNKNYQCNICFKEFMSKNGLKRHTLTTHSDNATVFDCKVCGKSFTQRSSLDLHERLHTGERPEVCSKCGKRFYCRSNLLRHLATHASDRQLYPCPQCLTVFTQRAHIRRHIKNVHNSNVCQYICSQCGKANLKSLHDLEVHEAVCRGERPYVCVVCNKAYGSPEYLKMHVVLVHKGERRYACEICEKRFHRSSHAKRHMQHKHDSRPTLMTVAADTDGSCNTTRLKRRRRRSVVESASQ